MSAQELFIEGALCGEGFSMFLPLCIQQPFYPHHGIMKEQFLTIRAQSGLSGDMLLAGLAQMNGATQNDLDALLATLKLPTVKAGCVHVEAYAVQGVGGWRAFVDIPHEHAHRTVQDIQHIITASAMPENAKKLASRCFALLAEAEGNVHGIPAHAVIFHEVGALDSIIDICLGCMLFEQLQCGSLWVSPLPMADGSIHCAHGVLPSPAPAVLQLLEGVEVCPFTGQGETVTPTAIALLKSWNASFGLWPQMKVAKTALVYGSKVFENAPNGAIFALGEG